MTNDGGGGNHILLGHVGQGTINISGGSLTTDRFNLGQYGWNIYGAADPSNHARGVVNQTGGTVNVDTAVVVGEASGNDNIYNLSAGTLSLRNTTTNNVSMIVGSSRGRGTFNLSGTAVATFDSHLFAGSGNASFATAIGTINISGGTLELGKNLRFTTPGLTNFLVGGFLVAGEFGVADVNISGGNSTMDFIQLGRRHNGTARGQVTQTGGAVTVGRSITVGSLSPLNNFYDISAGTLDLTGVIIEPGDPPLTPR